MAANVPLGQGLGAFQPVDGTERLPSQTTAELVVLRDVADQLRGIAEDLDEDAEPDEEEGGRKPSYLRGDFDANLAEELPDSVLATIAAELLEGIQADLDSRKDWEAMVERAIKFCGLIYEEASGEASTDGSISKAWHTLILESAIGFWANAHAQFLPADGPVKVRDDTGDKPQGAPATQVPLDDDQGSIQQMSRTQLAEAFEAWWNHYLTVVLKAYYRDFSRMLFSLGPKGTEFRKVFRDPMDGLVKSEWVKSENLIVSNDCQDLWSAGRVSERIMMRHADVMRMMWKGHWRDVQLSRPVEQTTRIEEAIGRSQGIQARIQRSADYLYEFFDCSSDIDLPTFEHEEDGRITGLPLPYRVTLDKHSRQIVDIRRNWKEGDDEFTKRQRYVMFGMLPGFGLYYLGYVHVLGNTERALTALEREVIDNTMLGAFPAWFAAKGAFSRGDTQVRLGPMAVKEVDLGMQKSINDVVQPITPAPLSPMVMAVFEKLEANGRALSGKFDLPVGEGTANIPVGTMIAMIEQGTTVMNAVHKGLHSARAEEFELMRELIAEDPEIMARCSKDELAWDQLVDEFEDMDLVPSSDPNTPSHIHRIIRATALGQVSQLFPGRVNQDETLEELLDVMRFPDPQRFILPPPDPNATPPDPKIVAEQTKLQIAQINAQGKAQDTQIRAQQSEADRASKEKVAQTDAQEELIKTRGQLMADAAKQKHQATVDTVDANADRAHDLLMQQSQQSHEATQGHLDRTTAPPQPPQRLF